MKHIGEQTHGSADKQMRKRGRACVGCTGRRHLEVRVFTWFKISPRIASIVILSPSHLVISWAPGFEADDSRSLSARVRSSVVGVASTLGAVPPGLT